MDDMIRVLFVDDSRLDRDLVRDSLEREHSGFLVAEAGSREELELRLTEGTYDLLITDFNILGFDGLQVVDLVRTKVPQLPVVILTGTGSEQIAVDALRRGVDDYVIKTREHISRLPKTILSVLEKRRIQKERLEAIEAWRLGRERLNLALEAGSLGLWDWNVNTDEVYYDGRWANMLGYSAEEIEPHLSAWLRLVHADDKNNVLASLDKHARGLTPRFQAEQRLRTKSGEWRWILVLGRIIERNQDGKPVRIIGTHLDITERKQAEEALRSSEERFRILAEGAFEGVVISRNGRILDANEVFCRLSGYSLEDIVGMRVSDMMAPEFRDIAALHMLSGSEEAYESAFLHKDGHAVPVQVKGKTIPYDGGDARIASVRDVSATRKAEEIRKRLATAIEQAAEAVLITDAQGRIQYANPAVERITGYSTEEFLGKTPRVFKSGEHDETFYRQLWETITTGKTWSGRFVNRRKDGTILYEDATISPVKDPSGRILNFVAVKRDVTDHLKLTEQLSQAQKMEAVGTLAGGVAHDFNNILQVVLGYTELLLAGKGLPKEHMNDLGKVLQAAQNGADLVRQLLTFSRQAEFKPRPVNLNRRIEQLEKMLTRTIPRMIAIELVLGQDLATIEADHTQIDQVLMNLALNARDAMPDGGRLIIETGNVNLDEHYCKTHPAANPGRYVQLSVSDTGHGMDKEILERIFDPFFTTKGAVEGTGLGLAMVYGIVKQHRGHIVCYSEPRQGTKFTIYIPALTSGEETATVVFRPIPQGGPETILIVDDEELIRELGSRILSKVGYKVIEASNGKEALNIYRERQQEVSLVILDLIMPEMGGAQCLPELLTINPELKILIASGFSANVGTRKILDSGAKGFVHKPFNMTDMLETVRKVLDEE